jgi:hypothetical protein
MRLVLTLAGMLALTAVSVAAASPDASEPVDPGCPQYVRHLRTARECLERGDRAAALAELRVAREALRACLAEDEGETEIGLGPASPSSPA